MKQFCKKIRNVLEASVSVREAVRALGVKLENNQGLKRELIDSLMEVMNNFKEMFRIVAYSIEDITDKTDVLLLDVPMGQDELSTQVIVSENINKKIATNIEDITDETEVFVGNLNFKEIDVMPNNLRVITGNANFLFSPITNFKKLEIVGGYLNAIQTEGFIATHLIRVGSHLNVLDSGFLTIPSLEAVGGYLNAGRVTEFDAPSLISVGSYLNAGRVTEFDAPNLKTIGLGLNVKKATSINVHNLKSVGLDLDARAAITFNAPRLESVKRDLIIHRQLDYDFSTVKVGRNFTKK